MKLTPHLCPECGALIRGTLETIPGTALLLFDEDSQTYDYDGSTDVDWNGQETIAVPYCPSMIVAECLNHHTFPVTLTQ